MKAHPAETRERVARLRAQGWSYKRIARELDVSRSTVLRWLNPDYADRQRAKSRERHKRYAGTCRVCGRPTSGANGAAAAASICGVCSAEAQRVLSDADVEYAVKRYRDDRVGCWTIARELGTNAQTVDRYLRRRLGALRPHRRSSWTRLPVAELAERYEAGESMTALATAYEVGISAVAFQLRGAGVRIRSLAEANALRRQRERAAR